MPLKTGIPVLQGGEDVKTHSHAAERGFLFLEHRCNLDLFAVG